MKEMNDFDPQNSEEHTSRNKNSILVPNVFPPRGRVVYIQLLYSSVCRFCCYGNC